MERGCCKMPVCLRISLRQKTRTSFHHPAAGKDDERLAGRRLFGCRVRGQEMVAFALLLVVPWLL